MILIFGSAILCLCTVLIVLDEGPSYFSGAGGPKNGMTDRQRKLEYMSPEEVNKIWFREDHPELPTPESLLDAE